MIELIIFPAHLNCRSASPFSMKAELLLRMCKLDYKATEGGDPSNTPNSKFPIIIDDGKTIADTHFIYQHICRKYNVSLDAGLSKKQVATATAFTRLAEDHLYWIMVYSRWLDTDFAGMTDVFFEKLPFGIRQLVTRSVRGKVKEALYHHGISRHSKDKIYNFGCDDIDAIAAQLNDNAYFLGDRLASVDAIIYAILAVLIYPDMYTKTKAQVMKNDNLLAYMKRIEVEFDYAPLTQSL